MRIYVGQTRSRKLVADLAARGWGEMTCPGEFPPRRHPWALDNGAFRSWKKSGRFDSEAFMDTLAKVEATGIYPDFIVVPDIVAGGLDSLHFSRTWAPHLRRYVVPLYLVVQDGMDSLSVALALREFDGLFVGGTLPWKIRTGRMWCRLAHSHGKPCHVGRVGTPNRVRWARRCGVDSLDSSLPLWSTRQLAGFAQAISGSGHPELFAPGASG